MGLGEAVNYIIFTNPVSAQVGQFIKKTGIIQPKLEHQAVQIYQYEPLHKLAQGSGGQCVRLAGLLGASAVVLGAYGAHKSYPEENAVELRRIYETANRFHFIHTVALLGAPLCRKPALCATFFTLGILLFSGTCYYTAFTGRSEMRKLAPIGGTCFILGWLSMVI